MIEPSRVVGFEAGLGGITGRCGRAMPRAVLLALAVALLVAGGATRSYAVNGEVEGAQGTYKTSCVDLTTKILCDDRVDDDGIASCHQRSADGTVDEGVAYGLCTEGLRIVEPGDPLETQVKVQATDFVGMSCLKSDTESPSCVVCATYVETPASGPPVGRTGCVRIVNGAGSDPASCTTSTCVEGPFSISHDTSGICTQESQTLEQTFSAPYVGFIMSEFIENVGQPGGRQILLCNGRHWEAVAQPADDTPVSSDVVVRAAEGEGSIWTPLCTKLASGRSYCF